VARSYSTHAEVSARVPAWRVLEAQAWGRSGRRRNLPTRRSWAALRRDGHPHPQREDRDVDRGLAASTDYNEEFTACHHGGPDPGGLDVGNTRPTPTAEWTTR